jgi:hypothetical protein
MKHSSRSKKHKLNKWTLPEPKPAKPNRLNMYTCDNDHNTITIDLNEGVTPFMIDCMTLDCGLIARSHFYNVSPELIPAYEWYYPTNLKGLHPAEVEHVVKGGLLLRKIDQ